MYDYSCSVSRRAAIKISRTLDAAEWKNAQIRKPDLIAERLSVRLIIIRDSGHSFTIKKIWVYA